MRTGFTSIREILGEVYRQGGDICKDIIDHQNEVDDYSNECSVVKCSCSGFLSSLKCLITSAAEDSKFVVEIDSACDNTYEWHDDVINQR